MRTKIARLFAALGFSALIGSAYATEPVNITYGYHPYWTGGWNGVIIKAKDLWKKHLPAGSTVKFEPHLTGPPMVNALLANKMQVGTMGDMPSLVATTKNRIADIRLVSVPMFSQGQQCNKIVVRTNAPDFENVEEAVKWLDGKKFAVHRGTCANRFVESIIRKDAFKPSQVMNMPIEVIASNFESGSLDAAAMWEPHARRQVALGHAKYLATGAPWDENDADFTLMRQDFIEKHPEAAAGWLKAEIEAVQFMQQHPEETVDILHKELTGYSKDAIWGALYAKNPKNIGGAEFNYVGKMIFDEEVMDLMKKGYAFLHEVKVTRSPDMPAHPINEEPLKRALSELGLTAPVAEIRGQNQRTTASN